MPTATAEDRAGLRLPHKLAVAVLVLAALLALVLLGYVGPAMTASFRDRSRELLGRGGRAMQALAADLTREDNDVLVDLIAHTTTARQLALLDLPSGLYRDEAALREALRADDEQRGARLRRNAVVLAQQTRTRAEQRITRELDALLAEQTRLAGAFARDLRRTHVLLCGALLAVALAVLLLGLHRLVVRPVAGLRAATRRLAAGDLHAEVPAGAPDELGALAADFSAMVRQLRQSRAELAALTGNLEREVAQKTHHLEQALADLKQSHRELAQAEKMASIGTLAGGIAHEFNNLVGGIRGCAAEARRDETDPARAETLDVILRAADRATAITSQLLRFAKRTAHRDEPVDLAAVLHDALALCEPEARRRNVAVVRDLPPALPLRGDGDGLHQVFVNLFTNALQAMPQGGRLTVAARATPACVEVTVADTGAGIPAADLDRIFEPFFSRRAGGGEAAGTGLGLSVSYGIVDAHGGTITVTSAVGVGTTFCVRLPAPGQAAAAPRR